MSAKINDGFHIGILVHDIEAAIPRFEEVLQISFHEPSVVTIDEGDWSQPARPDITREEVRAAWSRNGPPFIELLEAHGDGLFSAGQGEGFHHFGVYADDTQRCRAVLATTGVRSEVDMHIPHGGPLTWMSEPTDLHGIRVEFCDESLREGFTAWVTATGEDT